MSTPNRVGDGSARGGTGVLGAAVLWGTIGPAQVFAASAADPGALGAARLLLGAAALCVARQRRADWRRLLHRATVGWVLLAAVATGVFQVAFMHAVHQLGAAMGTAIALGVAPVATGVCARWWAGDRLGANWAASTTAAVAGCVVMLDPWGAQGATAGALGIALLSGACYGVYTVAAKKFLAAGAPPLPAATATLVIAGLLCAPLLGLHHQHLADPRSLLLIAWLAIGGTSVAYASFVYGLRRTTASAAGTLSLAEPLVAVALGILVLHERPSTTATLGCLLLLASLVTVVAAGPREAKRISAHRSAWLQRSANNASFTTPGPDPCRHDQRN